MKRTSLPAREDVAPAQLEEKFDSALKTITSHVGSDHLLDLILRNTGDLIVILDKNGKTIYNSPSYRKVLGDPDAPRGTIAFTEIHPEEGEHIKKLFQETVRTGRGKRAEFRFLLADGSVKHIESRGHIVRDAKKEILYVVVIARDITSQHIAVAIDRDVTSRKHGEEERARLKMAVDQAAESILITEPDGRIVYVNPAFERITGYRREEVLGRSPAILGSGKHDRGYFGSLWRTISQGEVWSGSITNRKKDGSLYEEEMVISPVRDSSGSIVNYVAVRRDMTRELEMERRLRQSQKMESLGQLAGGIAHDFNNVLGVIQGGLALLKSHVSDPSHLRYIEISESAVCRGADVAQRLLVFSRDGQVQLRPLSFAEVAEELIRVLEHTIEKTIELVTDIPADLPIIQGDSGQLYQVLLNLCINARDAILHPEGPHKTGRITISATTIPGSEVRKNFKDATAPVYVRVSVSDTGSGMTNEVRSRIFEPFFSTKPPGKGTGLGLAVAYGIVKSHFGMIDVETSPGTGTTFHIYLVAYPEEKLAVPEVRDDVIVGGNETILVVEDEEALRHLLAELLQSYGYTVLQAEDGVSAFEQFTDHRDEIKAVITDMGLPRMSGQDLFTKIREVSPLSRVVLASGYLDPELKTRLFTLGAKAFLQKPYQPADILRVLRGVIDVSGPVENEVPS